MISRCMIGGGDMGWIDGEGEGKVVYIETGLSDGGAGGFFFLLDDKG